MRKVMEEEDKKKNDRYNKPPFIERGLFFALFLGKQSAKIALLIIRGANICFLFQLIKR